MKSDSLGIKFINRKEQKAARILYDIVVSVRKDIAKSYDISKIDYTNYQGLCNLAIELTIDRLKRYGNEHNIKVEFKIIHGEQKHSPYLNSSLWSIQHTWIIVTIIGVTMYVDPTSGQFKRIYDYIPDFYISTIKPKWFYPDSDNPAFNTAFTRWINKNIRIPVTKKSYDGKITKFKLGIIQFCQYKIWGKICDSRKLQERKYVDKI